MAVTDRRGRWLVRGALGGILLGGVPAFFAGWYLAIPTVPQGLIGVLGAAVGALGGVSGSYFIARAQVARVRAEKALDYWRTQVEKTENVFKDLLEMCDRLVLSRTESWSPETADKLLGVSAEVSLRCPKVLRQACDALLVLAAAAAGKREEGVQLSEEELQDLRHHRDVLAETLWAYLEERRHDLEVEFL